MADEGEQKVAAGKYSITLQELESINVDQMKEQNLEHLVAMGGVDALANKLGVDVHTGLSAKDTTDLKNRGLAFGRNEYPEPPMDGWWTLFFESFKDLTLIVLIIAAVVSLVVGFLEDPTKGWIDGVAILIAVLLVATVTATNDYQKERQFRSLSKVSEDITINVIRDGEEVTISVHDLVVGDVCSLMNGDKVPADGVYISGDDLESNESSLTGEPDDLRKNRDKDPFLLSGCNITAGQCHMLVIAVGAQSRWGRIKSRLATEAENTPLQDKLDTMAKNIGYIGGIAALFTLVAMLILWFVNPKDGFTTAQWIIHSFIIAVTIIVVAVPEGLPLAVTISLAFSTRKMLADQNLIRVLAACETMGNATNICSDKTGTLTENRMTVVECWAVGRHFRQASLPTPSDLPDDLTQALREGFAANSTAFLEYNPVTEKNEVRGSKTEGALIMFGDGPLAGDYKKQREACTVAKQYPFSSAKKMMSTLVRLPGGGLRVYVKGASEYVLGRCTQVFGAGGPAPLDEGVQEELQGVILQMARGALRTIGIAHRDFASEAELPEGWEQAPPDDGDLTFDALCGIQDPLRDDVVDAVRACQKAGIMVRMVTGDNIETAKAIAKQCGILTEGGLAMEGPAFRDLTPEQLDAILPKLQVLARSSPTDKHTLVVRLNGVKLPRSQAEWQEEHPGSSWQQLRDRLLPGYREEWEAARATVGANGKKATPEGEVVGVTGDGTNDAPALKAADVGLSMGKTGTEVAKEASDIVILDDRFSSIKQAVLWGRSVYDNIRKFLQFQLTVNVVALAITFLAAVLDYNPPLNPVMMLWVNLIMDTMGALALGTEPPTAELLDRRPYKRSAFLVSRPMWRNIFVQSAYQLAMLLVLLIAGGGTQTMHAPAVMTAGAECGLSPELGDDFTPVVSDGMFGHLGVVDGAIACRAATVQDVSGSLRCVCDTKEYTHFTFIFNAFVWCQIFNEFNARRINDDWNVFRGLLRNYLFIAVIVVSVVLQFLIVEFGGEFTKTTSLSWQLWLWSFGFGIVSLPLGVLMRFIPVSEDPRCFAGYADSSAGLADSAAVNVPHAKRGSAIVVVPAEDKAAAGSGGTQ